MQRKTLSLPSARTATHKPPALNGDIHLPYSDNPPIRSEGRSGLTLGSSTEFSVGKGCLA